MKKIGCALEQAARAMMRFGEGISIWYGFIDEVRLRWPMERHGLRQKDVLGSDRMSVPRWYRICSPKVRDLLLILKSEGRAVCGLIAFLDHLRDYLNIAFDLKMDHFERVRLCSKVANFQCLWRHWIFENTGGTKATVDRSCVSLPAFRDLYISCHDMVNKIGIIHEKNKDELDA